MAELITAGADVLRLNFSHGTRDEHAENIEMARQASELAGREVGVLGDLPGPKLRLDEVEGGVVELREGSEVTLTTGEEVGAADHLPGVVGRPSLGGPRGRGDLPRGRQGSPTRPAHGAGPGSRARSRSGARSPRTRG